MKLFNLLLLVFLGFFSSVSAATLTWVGGNGNWNQASNWSGGTIPSLSDDVIIGSGHDVDIPPNYWAFAGSIEIGSGSELAIKGNCTVKHSATYGIEVRGTLKVLKNLSVYGVGTNKTGIRIQSSGSMIVEWAGIVSISGENKGIDMYGGIVENKGQIEITDVDDDAGIYMMSNAMFFNFPRASVFIDETQTTFTNALYLWYGSLFENKGLLEVGSNSAGRALFSIQGSFYNTDGRVSILSSQSEAILSYGGTFENDGVLDVYSGGGIDLTGVDATNQAGGIINITSGSGPGKGLKLSATDFVNHGAISIDGFEGWANYLESGIFMNSVATLLNSETGTIDLTTSFPDARGITISQWSDFTNKGDISIELSQIDDQAIRLDNEGQLNNESCGHISIHEGVLSLATTVTGFTNQAWLDVLGVSAGHINSGTIQNEGIIYDANGTLSGLPLTNQGVIVDPLTAPVQANTVESNALTLGNLAPTGSMSWRTAPGGSLAGVYVPASNSLVVLESAVSRTEIYLEIELDVAGCQETRWLAVEVPGGVLPPPPPPLLEAVEITNTSWKLSPNPAMEYVELSLAAERGTPLRIQLVNQLGQVVFEGQSTGEEGAVYRMERPAGLTSGWYVVRVMGEEGLLYTQSIVWR